jgi:hypothetical protein
MASGAGIIIARLNEGQDNAANTAMDKPTGQALRTGMNTD